jgi:hypothetical protein
MRSVCHFHSFQQQQQQPASLMHARARRQPCRITWCGRWGCRQLALRRPARCSPARGRWEQARLLGADRAQGRRAKAAACAPAAPSPPSHLVQAGRRLTLAQQLCLVPRQQWQRVRLCARLRQPSSRECPICLDDFRTEPQVAGWVGLAGVGWLGGWVGWAGWLGGWVAGWLGGWVAGWLGGWVAGPGLPHRQADRALGSSGCSVHAHEPEAPRCRRGGLISPAPQ